MIPNLDACKQYRAQDLRERSRIIFRELNLPKVPGSTLRFKRILEFPDGRINYVYFYEPAELKGTRYGLPHYILMDAMTDSVRWATNEETFMIMNRELPEVVPAL